MKMKEEYEEERCGIKGESDRSRQRLDGVFKKPQVGLHKAGLLPSVLPL